MGWNWSTKTLLAVLVTAWAGCSNPGSAEGVECSFARDCGEVGDAVCVGGNCLIFDDTSGYGGAVVDLSFHRDLYSIAKSGYIWFVLGETAGGTVMSCSDLLDGNRDLRENGINPLQVNPKYLIFHWDMGGTFFPNNLVQFIRPATGVVAVAEGYQNLEGEGALTAFGCQDGIDIVRDQNANVVIPLDVPSWR